MDPFLSEIAAVKTLRALEELKTSFFGKNGKISTALRSLGSLSEEERNTEAPRLNALKAVVLEALEKKRTFLEEEVWKQKLESEAIDTTLPSPERPQGFFHPLMQALSESISLFCGMGFSVRRGPDVESDFYNFTALNFPQFHPARTMQDTFYIDPETVLRTHTSPMQIRCMQKEGAPLRIVVPGRVYRSDYDQTHSPLFHQIEGLVVGEEVTMGHLKGCLDQFLGLFFQKPIHSRFRPSFFPFTEPSAEVDIPCTRSENGIYVGEGKDWLEVLGCGMVHPHVLEACNLDPKKVRGFAFGVGIERLAMLKYGITDLRLFYTNDQRWLKAYGFPSTTPGL